MKDYKKYLNPATKVPMIEVLEGDILVDKINLTRKKISIKHYLNIYLFPNGEDVSGSPRYPLYYRVIFNKQSVKIKSAIDIGLSLQEFNQLSTEQFELLRREALILTHVVNDIYTNVIEASSNNYGDDLSLKALGYLNYSVNAGVNASEIVKQSFDINQIFNTFNFNDLELPLVVEKKILQNLSSFAVSINKYQEYEGIFKQTRNINSYQLLQFLKSQNNEWTAFEERYHPLIWYFNLYYHQFTNQSTNYQSLGATQIDFEYLDFKKQFLEYYDGKDFEILIEDISNLLKY